MALLYTKKAKSGIKIKEENKGKFTATKKSTGKSTEELTHSKNPVTKKQAGGPLKTKEDKTIKPDYTGMGIGFMNNPIVHTRDDFKGNILSIFTQGLAGSHGKLEPGNTYADLRNYYAGYDPNNGTLRYSKYRPSSSKNENDKYIALATPEIKDLMMTVYNDISKIEESGGDYDKAFHDNMIKQYGKTLGEKAYNKNKNLTKNSGPLRKIGANRWNVPRYYQFGEHLARRSGLGDLGNYQISTGEDENGKYISYYDIWDTESGAEALGAAKPFEVYDRVYLKDNKAPMMQQDNKQTRRLGGLLKRK